MNLQIPEGETIQIIIGKTQPLALMDQRQEVPMKTRGRSISTTLFKCLLIGGLVFGGYIVGQLRGQAADAAAGFPAPPSVTQAFPSQTAAPNQAAAVASPEQAVAAPQPAGAPPLPPGFAAQLQQPPTIQPPPGQNAGAGNNPANPFGLH